MSLFDEIRAASRAVAERARSVHIDEARLSSLAGELLSESPSLDPDPAHAPFADAEHTLAFVVTLDALNFGSGWFPAMRKRPGCSGYFTMALALREQFEKSGPWDAAALSRMDARRCASLLGQDLQKADMRELMGLYAESLVGLGKWLDARFGGSFPALREAAGASAERLVRWLAEMPFYRDVAVYEELRVPFYKRAQITVADLARSFEGSGTGHFEDQSALTLFADNLVPHVLRCEGVLRYAPALTARIDAGELLVPGSREEVEIRAVALHAVERLVALQGAEPRLVAQDLDEILWRRGQRPEIKAHPRHRARCVYY